MSQTLTVDFLPMLAATGAGHAAQPHPGMITFFALMLISIAVMPLWKPDWWHHNYPKVAICLGAITASYYAFVLKDWHRLGHVAHEYVSFISLIGSLFVVSGGIHIRVKGESTPTINCVFLFIGAVLANIIGTTGASMLLIRPWMRMNKYRITAFHVVFFIFIVSNVGGCLTPIGDPPLFLGLLRGVPFWWVLKACLPGWLMAIGMLIAVFFVVDRINFLRAPKQIRDMETANETWRFEGLHNIFFILVILFAVFVKVPPFLSEALMIGAAVGSYFTTHVHIHEANDFNFEPIREVGWLFVGIFATMIPALQYLEANANSLGLDSPMKFYWFTGLLSGVLDNAPTYLTFLAAALGREGLSLDNTADVVTFVGSNGVELMAISLGAVFFGAMTYIGNGPNFMVRSITQHAKVRTPSFFGYIYYSSIYLLPILIIVSIVVFYFGVGLP